MFNLAWERYKILGNIIGNAQGRVFNFLFYFTIMVPFGIGLRLLGDPLDQKQKQPQWVEREPVSTGMEEARRQG